MEASTSDKPVECDVEKRVRNDRSEKLIERQELDLTVVKAALQKYIKGENSVVKRIVRCIKERVELLSVRTVEMSYALLGLTKELFDGVVDVTSVQLDDMFEQTFIRQLLLGAGGANDPAVRVVDYYIRHPELLPSPQRHFYDRNIYSAAAITYLTNLKNSLRVINFNPKGICTVPFYS